MKVDQKSKKMKVDKKSKVTLNDLIDILKYRYIVIQAQYIFLL